MSDEVEILQETKAIPVEHQCYLCCEGESLVTKLLQYGGVLNYRLKYACEACDKAFERKPELYEHVKEHSADNKSDIQNNEVSPLQESAVKSCPTCNKKCKSHRKLQEHIMKSHRTEMPNAICKMDFFKMQQQLLSKLSDSVNGVDILHMCTQCGKNFLWESTLKQHPCCSS